MGKLETVDSIKKLVIYNKDGNVLRIEDIANVMVSTEDRESYNRMNAKESVFLYRFLKSREEILYQYLMQ